MTNQTDKLRKIMNERMNSAISRNKTTRVVAVTSGKGGVGKSNISLNLAIALKNYYKNIYLMDADLGLANVDVLLGITPEKDLRDFISGEAAFKEIIVEGPNGIKIIPAASGVVDLVKLNDFQKKRILSEMMSLSEADVIIIDTAAGISENVTGFLFAANEVIIISTNEPTSFTDAYAVLKTVNQNDSSKRINMIVNMVKDAKQALGVAQGLNAVAQKFLGTTLNYLGFLPYDSAISQSVLRQKPFSIQYPQSPAAASINKIAENVYMLLQNNKTTINEFIKKLAGDS